MYKMKREKRLMAKLSIYHSIYVLTLTCCHKLWVVTERTRLQVQASPQCVWSKAQGVKLGQAGGTWRRRIAASLSQKEPV